MLVKMRKNHIANKTLLIPFYFFSSSCQLSPVLLLYILLNPSNTFVHRKPTGQVSCEQSDHDTSLSGFVLCISTFYNLFLKLLVESFERISQLDFKTAVCKPRNGPYRPHICKNETTTLQIG